MQEPPVLENDNFANNGSKGGNEVILVIEDDDYVREYTATILGELGYRVLEAADTEAALSIASELEDLSLIFADVGLRGELTIDQCIESTRQKHPRLRVLFTSGYAREAIAHRLPAYAVHDLIIKPFSFEDLARKVRCVLDKQP
jgi:CheY-like chemotaxis protein